MNWTDLVKAVSERSGVPAAQTRKVLGSLSVEIREKLQADESVSVRGLGTWSRAFRKGRVVRSVSSRRKMWIGGRYRVRFRPTRSLQEAIDQEDASWRSDEEQKAWRLAETLLDDLELYHSDSVPEDLDGDADAVEIEAACREAFGAAWEQAEHTWNERHGNEVKTRYLGLVAQRRWT